MSDTDSQLQPGTERYRMIEAELQRIHDANPEAFRSALPGLYKLSNEMGGKKTYKELQSDRRKWLQQQEQQQQQQE